LDSRSDLLRRKRKAADPAAKIKEKGRSGRGGAKIGRGEISAAVLGTAAHCRRRADTGKAQIGRHTATATKGSAIQEIVPQFGK